MVMTEAILIKGDMRRGVHGLQVILGHYGDPGLPPRTPVMHTIHDPRKTGVNPHNRVGITEYIIHYIMNS
jgi:hypothetical protein